MNKSEGSPTFHKKQFIVDHSNDLEGIVMVKKIQHGSNSMISCDSSVSTQNTDFPSMEEDDFQPPVPTSIHRKNGSQHHHNGPASPAIRPPLNLPISSILSTSPGEIFHEETKNFWKPNRGVHITILKHASCQCLELIATDANDRELEANNEHIFIDLIKLTQKCSAMMNNPDDGFLINLTRPLPNKHQELLWSRHNYSPATSPVKVDQTKEAQLKKVMIKYILDRLMIETTSSPKKKQSSGDMHANEFQIILRPLAGDDVKYVNGKYQLDVLCARPEALLLKSILLSNDDDNQSVSNPYSDFHDCEDQVVLFDPRPQAFKCAFTDSSDEEDDVDSDSRPVPAAAASKVRRMPALPDENKVHAFSQTVSQFTSPPSRDEQRQNMVSVRSIMLHSPRDIPVSWVGAFSNADGKTSPRFMDSLPSSTLTSSKGSPSTTAKGRHVVVKLPSLLQTRPLTGKWDKKK